MLFDGLFMCTRETTVFTRILIQSLFISAYMCVLPRSVHMCVLACEYVCMFLYLPTSQCDIYLHAQTFNLRLQSFVLV